MENKELNNFINEKLKNKNNKLEGQRLKESWFLKNKIDEYQFFLENNLFNSKLLYMFINNVTDKCECGSEKRFIGFNDGFKVHCEKCARTKYNSMKISGSKKITINDIVNYVKDKNNNYSTSKIKNLSSDTLQLIQERTNYLPNDTSISERIYHIEYNLFKLPICKLCGKEHNNFRFSNNGYFDYCKGECSYIYNKDIRQQNLKQFYYNKYVEKFKSTDDYDIKLFSFNDYIENKDLVVKFKHLKCGFEYDLNINYQGHLKCPKCFPIRSKKQYEIFEWMSKFTVCEMNNRQFIKPLELDILCENFAIEYDSLMFHSCGKSTLEMFNNTIENKNYHLNKTEKCEEKGIQLFRIFSNEWQNQQDIWKSVINSKINNTKRIFARKCIIKEVKNEEANDFLNRNHLQEAVNSKIKIGLYYNNKLVSLMTFGKTRRDKWKGENNYELLRFCSELNYTIIGGASKLLKYFELKFLPEMILSYANRRWSTGNVYEKLGFEFIENTTPNYFYFKGDDNSKLFSREQFQKHKLKDKLEVFDEKLTESENMYNNNFRKIFDCGHKIYIKKYK
jgi:hypothetical protein